MQISEPRAIRALTHPLRLDLLELLLSRGGLTAAQCGRALGVPQANVSFHLRQLAKYGLVEDAGAGADRRERVWQLVEGTPSLRIDAGENAVAQRQLERLVVEREAEAILEFGGRRDPASQQWRQTAGTVMTAIAVLSPEEAAELKRQWKALLEPYLTTAPGAAPQPGRRAVRFLLATTPLRDGSDDEEVSAR